MKPSLLKWIWFIASLLAAAVAPAPLLAQTTVTLAFIHTDVAGSVIAATDEAGNVIWRENYRPYGERTVNNSASGANRQFFHGKAFDADTGLSYVGARYYDPIVGRFMGVDLQGFDERNLHSFNRYGYGNNNPHKYRDPNGKAVETIIDVVSLGFSIAAYREEPSLVNALGVTYDAVAAAVPFLPGGIGALRQAGKISKTAGETLAASAKGRSLDDIIGDQQVFNRWLKHSHPTDKPISAGDAQRVWDKLLEAGKKPRLDEGHPGTKWDMPHINVEGAHIPVEAGFKPAVP